MGRFDTKTLAASILLAAIFSTGFVKALGGVHGIMPGMLMGLAFYIALSKSDEGRGE